MEKKGDETQGVGKFYDHSEGRYIHGNNFVTSCLQVGENYIPHKSKMYLKEDAAEAMDEEFRTKLEIAYEEMIEPLETPEGTDLYVVFDSWWYSSDLIGKINNLGHEVVCRLKSNKKILVNGEEKNVRNLAENLEFEEVAFKVRGKEKEYLASILEVKIPKLGRVRLVVSKKGEDGDFHYCMSTDLDLTMKEILQIYENRWSVEIAHKEANQKFGFKEYQMRDKEAIERFMQISFLSWTIIVLAHTTGKEFETVIEEMGIGEILDEVKLLYLIETVMVIKRIVETSTSKEELGDRMADFFWS